MNNSIEKFLETLQLKTVLKFYSNCQQIIFSVNQVTLYFYEKQSDFWLKDHLYGTLIFYQTNDSRKFSMIFLNNNLLVDMPNYSIYEFSEINLFLTDKYINVDQGGQYVIGLLFSTTEKASECYNELSKCSNHCKLYKQEHNIELSNEIAVKDINKQSPSKMNLMTTLSLSNNKTYNNKFKQSSNKKYSQSSNKHQMSNQFARNTKQFNKCERKNSWWRKPES